MEITFIFGALVVSVLSGVLTAGAVMALGGVGVLRALHRRVLLVEERIEDTDTRITREVKRRAADKALEARETDPRKLAQEHLENQPGSRNRKPSIVGTLKA